MLIRSCFYNFIQNNISFPDMTICLFLFSLIYLIKFQFIIYKLLLRFQLIKNFNLISLIESTYVGESVIIFDKKNKRKGIII